MGLWSVAIILPVALVMCWMAGVQVVDGHLTKQRVAGLVIGILIWPVIQLLVWLLA